MKDADGLQRGVSVNLYAPLKEGQKWKLVVTGAAGKYIACCDYGEFDNGSNASTMAATACGKIPISVGAYVSRDKFTNLQGMERSSDWTVGERYPLSGMGPTFDGRDKPDVLAPGAHIISAINNYAASYNVNREDLAYTEVDALIPGRTNYWGGNVRDIDGDAGSHRHYGIVVASQSSARLRSRAKAHRLPRISHRCQNRYGVAVGRSGATEMQKHRALYLQSLHTQYCYYR